MPEEKMICPNCGSAMNHHADKLDYSTILTQSDAADSELGGILEEIHTCSQCRTTAVRKAK
ncbi:MAG: hypothetical protein NVS2B14_12740 [Chamaesiphon sp.]